MDIATVATEVIAALAPFLAKAGEKCMETLGEKIGEGVPEVAKALWQKLWPAVKDNPTAVAAVDAQIRTEMRSRKG